MTVNRFTLGKGGALEFLSTGGLRGRVWAQTGRHGQAVKSF